MMDESRAVMQDIRPLYIAVLNLMPLKEDTEVQLLRSLSNSPLQIEITFLTTASYIGKNTPASHLNEFYKTFEEVKDLNFVENLKNSGEITIPEGYTVTYEVSDLPDVASKVNEVMQKVKVRIDYKILNEEKSMFLVKLKIKEIYKDEG